MTDTASLHIKDTTDQDFIADVVEASEQQPVIVDFWAPWCGPCRTLGPIIEKAVESRNGQVKLVKINIDENPAYAGQLGVRSIPAVYAFDKGRPVDAFMGALPESQINAFIEKLMSGTDTGKMIAEALEQAEAASQAGDIGTAAQIYAAVIQQEPENVTAIAGLARCYLANGDKERATATLDMIPADKQNDSAVKGVRTAIEMMGDAAAEPDEFEEALSAVLANPDDHEKRFELAEKYATAGRFGDAIDHLLIILGTSLDWGEGKAKEKLLQMFEAAGATDPATVSGRRRLASLMFA
ncbi:thioredoxin [uncultured Hyphomonas sp.]|jgi:putative thioredoxin|uniref:thioredoxin n=1 Tax=uncultured Hyphomonas sp. TaxID=225298 RepID=UPI000C6275CA|nr:thioredoxin [Hyphomonadaceae bacterium]MBA29174.1 thioredoxin [Hyphomonadaceae bacterium]MBL4878515.1 thioredoxin [Hyphomonas sp.]|tara:strand:- start:22266 stop:23156 length:891 start_codon:yes stop_codon:yes gene_type:complete